MERDGRKGIDKKELVAFVASVRRAMRARADAGLLAYDGQWLPPAEVERGIARERRRAWVHVFELVLLYAVLTTMSLGLIALALYLCY